MNILRIILIAIVIIGISSGINISSFAILLTNLKLSSLHKSSVLSCEFIGSLVVAPFTLLLNSYFGIYRVMLLGLLTRTIGLLIFVSSGIMHLWMLGLFVYGAGTFLIINATQQIVNSIDSNNRAKNIAYINTFYIFGMGLGSLFLYILDLSASFRTINISIIIGMLSVILFLKLKKYNAEIAYITDISINKLFSYARLPFIAAFASEFAYYSLIIYIPLYALSHSVTQQNSYLLNTVINISMVFITIPVIKLLEKYNRINIITIATIALIIAFQLIKNSITNITMIVLILSVISVSLNIIKINSIAIIGDRFFGHSLVAAQSTINAMVSLGSYTGVIATGYCIDLMNEEGLIFSISAIFLVFLVYIALEKLGKFRK